MQVKLSMECGVHMIQTEQGMWSISWMNHTSISNSGFPHMADDDKGVNFV